MRSFLSSANRGLLYICTLQDWVLQQCKTRCSEPLFTASTFWAPFRIRDEMFARGRGKCVCEAIGAPAMLRLISRVGGLGEDVANLRFEPGVESSAAETNIHPIFEWQCLKTHQWLATCLVVSCCFLPVFPNISFVAVEPNSMLLMRLKQSLKVLRHNCVSVKTIPLLDSCRCTSLLRFLWCPLVRIPI